MAFCKHCGAQNDDAAEFCKGCGASMAAGASDAPAAKPALNVNRTWFIIGGAVVAAIIVIVLLVKLIGGGESGAEKAAKKFIDAVYNGDGKAVVNLLPPDYVNYLCDEDNENSDYSDAKELAEDYNDELADRIEKMDDEFNDKWSVKATVNRTKDVKAKKVDDMMEWYDNRHIYMNIEAATEVKLDLEGNLNGKDRTKKLDEITFIKVDGKWYINPDSCDRAMRAAFSAFLDK